MKKKRYIYGLILGLALTCITACSTKKEDTTISQPKDQDSNIDEDQTDTLSIMDEFHALISDGTSIKEIAAYIHKNIAVATGEEVSEMILKLEELHTKRREKEEEKYLAEAVQKGFDAIDRTGIDINQVDSIKDEAIKKLVIESKENGYKIETVEGYYFPIIDYSFYQQFSSYATPEIKDYINIMEVESDYAFAKAEILMIGWDEVVNRIILMEKFLNQYPESDKADYMKLKYDNYVFISLYGLNIPPLFDNKMSEDAKKAYATSLTQSKDSKFLKLLDEFMTLVEKNDYELTEEVDRFRKANTNSILYEDNETSKDPNRYQVAGIDDADEFDETYELLRAALSDNDKDTFADHIAYPINVIINGKKTEIKNKEVFLKNFDEIMNEDMKNIFLNQKLEDFFVNYQGIMVGNGQFWLNQLVGTKYKFSIYAINN